MTVPRLVIAWSLAAGLALPSISALAGGAIGASDVPAPHSAAPSAAPVAMAASSGSTDGCQPFEARNRNIPPRPRISASALLTNLTP